MAREATSPILMRNYLLCPEKPCSRTRILVGPSGTQLCETCFLILTKKYFCSSWGSCLPLTWDTNVPPQLSIHVFSFQQTTSLWSQGPLLIYVFLKSTIILVIDILCVCGMNSEGFIYCGGWNENRPHKLIGNGII